MLEHTQHSTSISMQVKLRKHKLATHACLRASSSARQTTHAQAIPETRPRLSSCARPLRLAKPDPPASSLALTTHARHAGPPRAAAGTMPCRPLPSPHPAAAFPPHARPCQTARAQHRRPQNSTACESLRQPEVSHRLAIRIVNFAVISATPRCMTTPGSCPALSPASTVPQLAAHTRLHPPPRPIKCSAELSSPPRHPVLTVTEVPRSAS